MSAHPYSGVGNPAEEADRCVEFGRQAFEPVAIAATARDHEQQVGPGQPHPCHGSDRGVEPLARHEPGDPDDHLGVVGDAEVITGGATLGGVERMELVGVDAAGHDGGRQRTTGGVLPLGGRVAACGDDPVGARQRVGQSLPGTGEAAGHRHLGAVEDEVVRQVQ